MTGQGGPRSSQPLLWSDTARVLSQPIEFALYPTDTPRLVSWLRSLGELLSGDLVAAVRTRRLQKASAEDVASALETGFSLYPKPGESLVTEIGASHERRGGVRWVTGSFQASPRASFEGHMKSVSEWFEEAVVALDPLYARLRFGGGASSFYNAALREQLLLVPIGSYEWRNYLTPAAMPGSLLGDGSTIDEPMFVDFGPLPLVSLAERDRVASLLMPLLPPRREPGPTYAEMAARRLFLASADGGVELPDEFVL